MGRVSCEHTGYPRQTLCIGFVPYGEIVKPILLEQIRIIDRVSSPMGKLLNTDDDNDGYDDNNQFRPLWGNC